MTQEKMRKVIAACVSAATVLLVLLLSFLIYQWITIRVLEKREQERLEEIKQIEELIRQGEEEAQWFESGPGKLWAAIENGWVPEAGD